jgi:hypothetical protein
MKPISTTATVESHEGLRRRLRNLVYDPGASEANPRLRAAIEQFQVDHGLPADGAPSDALRAKVLEAHGC